MRVFVTGAGSGIGLKVAQVFAERGAHIAGFDLNLGREALTQIETARRSPGQAVRAYPLDVTIADAVTSTFRRAADELGAPDVVFHAAGIGGFSRRFEEFPPDRFEEIVRVNLFGSRNVAAAALPLMQPGARLALVASLAGLTAAYGQSGYAASKHAVVGLASVLRAEYKPKGIAVCVICPPEIDTPMAQAERRDRPVETAAMKQFAGTVELDAGCRYMVDRVLRDRFLIIPGGRARVTWWIQKLLPRSVSNALGDRLVARARDGTRR